MRSRRSSATRVRPSRRRAISPPGPVQAQKAKLQTFRDRLDALPRSTWAVADQVDWYVLLSEMNREDFQFQVLRPWSRDPGMYVGLALPRRSRGALVEQTDPDVIADDEVAPLTAALRRVPAALDRAKTFLTEPTKNHAQLALRMIEKRNTDGTHYRYTTVLEKLERLERVAQPEHPDLAAAGRGSADALLAYAKWLRAGLDRMAAGGHIGLDNYTWYLQNVLLSPYTAQQVLALGERDYARTLTNLANHENANRKLPPATHAGSEAEYLTRDAEADRRVRR